MTGMESLGPGDASFGPFDFIFGTKQVYSVARLLREVRGDIYIITSKSELKLVFPRCFPLQTSLNPYMSLM